MQFVALHLPQFHPIPENDKWWGKGFTEWTNTAKAKPLFKGHYQPHVPADLGFYDLRLHEARVAQAEMAQQYGIDSFCFYHYWFAGKCLLEQPLEGLLAHDQPQLPFMFCWANQSWSGIWHGAPGKILIEQTYPGLADEKAHFDYLLPFFRDPRYKKITGCPVFCVYRPFDLPDLLAWTRLWRKMARDAAFPDLYLIGIHQNVDPDALEAGFDAVVEQRLPMRPKMGLRRRLERKWRHVRGLPGLPARFDYEASVSEILARPTYTEKILPMVLPNWDNTPRSGGNGYVLTDSTPEKWRTMLRKAIEATRTIVPGKRLIFIKSWNEWAEGNHLEPDLRFGLQYLEVLKEEIERETTGRLSAGPGMGIVSPRLGSSPPRNLTEQDGDAYLKPGDAI